MKLTKSLLIVALAGAAFAQAPANKNTAPAAGKPATPPATAKQAAPPATPVAAAPAKPTMPATKPETKAAKKSAPVKRGAKVVHTARKPAVPASLNKPMDGGSGTEATSEPAPEIKRGRDPFVSVIIERFDNGSSCTGAGKKCLMVDQVMLKGIVRCQAGPIAVVSSSANKTYFLRENDPVYNGVVVKITPDSIIFRESVTDRLGKTIQREVVKKVNPPAV